MPRKTKYTREFLEPYVARSNSLTDLMRRLGLPPNGGNHRNIKAHVRATGLDTSHFNQHTFKARVHAIPEEELRDCVARSLSIAAIAQSFDLPDVGRSHRELTQRIKILEIDTSHLRGAGWARGETMATHPSLLAISQKTRSPDSVLFSENAHGTNIGRRLVRRLLEEGWEYRCKICGITDWLGTPLVLHLDHVNGINNDNRRENLRLLCPNCHSQTETYCHKARPAKGASEPRAQYSCYTNDTRAWRNWLTQHV